METLNSSGSIGSGRGGTELLLPGPPELITGVLCLVVYAALFIWTFGVAELRSARSLPSYTICVSEYRLSVSPTDRACQ